MSYLFSLSSTLYVDDVVSSSRLSAVPELRQRPRRHVSCVVSYRIYNVSAAGGGVRQGSAIGPG